MESQRKGINSSKELDPGDVSDGMKHGPVKRLLGYGQMRQIGRPKTSTASAALPPRDTARLLEQAKKASGDAAFQWFGILPTSAAGQASRIRPRSRRREVLRWVRARGGIRGSPVLSCLR